MAKVKKRQKRQKARDANILASYKREINLRTRKIEKAKYSRKIKHKKLPVDLSILRNV